MVFASGEASWSWKSNAVLSSRTVCSRGAWTVLLMTEVSPQSPEKEMNSDNLMDSINQQVSNGNTQARMRDWVDWIHRIMNAGGKLRSSSSYRAYFKCFSLTPGVSILPIKFSFRLYVNEIVWAKNTCWVSRWRASRTKYITDLFFPPSWTQKVNIK